MKKTLSLLLCTLCMASCTEIIHIDIENANAELVVEANLATDSVINILLTQSVSLQDPSSYPVVDDAQIYVSDDKGNSELLTYVAPGRYESVALKGTIGENYSLDIVVGNNAVSSSSSMPSMVPFDSLVVEKGNLFGGIGTPSISDGAEGEYYEIKVLYKDPEEEENYYRFVEKINGEFIGYYLEDDTRKNGKEMEKALFRFDRRLKKDDVVRIEMQSVSKEFYLYLTTLNDLKSSTQRGSTPANPVSNLKGTQLGYFSTHTSQSKDVIIE